MSGGGLLAISRDEVPYYPRAVLDFGDLQQTYEVLWRTQPSVRTVTGFLARNIAQLGLHLFRRKGDDERERVTDHPLVATINRPNAWTTRYEMANALVLDLGIYDVAYWLKMRGTDGRLQLVRLPPKMTRPAGSNWLFPEEFVVTGPRGEARYRADQVVYFHGYNPDDPRSGVSPLETLRAILAEDMEAARYRGQMWRSGARASGYIQRPADAPDWSDDASLRFTEEFRDLYSGSGPRAGGVPVLEDGMTYVAAGYSAESAQYIEARKLTRDEVAAAYFVPPPMVGILEHATFSNITEQHKNLYQDTLGPMLQLVEQRLELDLLPEFANVDGLYLEHNLAEKLKGSFEEQASSMSTMVGAPVMTRNEGRARLNLPHLPEGEGLVVPLNVLVGGMAAPTDTDTSDEPKVEAPKAIGGVRLKAKEAKATPSARWREKYLEVLQSTFRRQEAAVMGKLGGKAATEVFDRARWDKELAGDLLAVNLAASTAAATHVLDQLGLDPEGYDAAPTVAWLTASAAGQATGINDVTEASLVEALKDPDPKAAVRHLFEVAVGARALASASAQSASAYGFGGREGAKMGGLTHKTWRTPSPRPRSTHARLNGSTVKIGDKFANGARWPGDSQADADETAGCTCEISFHLEDT